MGKIDTLNGYIEECDSAIKNKNYPCSLAKRIMTVYHNEAKISESLLSSDYQSSPSEDDIKILRDVLINHRDNIAMEEAKELREMETLKLQSAINITTNNNSNATANVNLSVSLVNTLERIQVLPSSVLDDKEKEELEDKLTVLQAALDKGDSDKAKSKLTNVLKYIGDKCVDVGIALLPYLGTVANSLGQ